MAAEIRPRFLAGAPGRPASMRPRRMAAEICVIRVLFLSIAAGFNEAAANGRGNSVDAIVTDPPYLASMRPRRMAAEMTRAAAGTTQPRRLQ